MALLRRTGNQEIPGTRLQRLAQDIDALAAKDDQYLAMARDIEAVRRAAALALYDVCWEFVTAVNGLLKKAELMLDPETFSQTLFQNDANNIFQISVRGRILQVTISATPDLISTEDFRVPYTLSGSVRAFNQELLDKEVIEEQLLFYTIEKERKMWRFFDPRTYRSGHFNQEYLVSVMEQLI